VLALQIALQVCFFGFDGMVVVMADMVYEARTGDLVGVKLKRWIRDT